MKKRVMPTIIVGPDMKGVSHMVAPRFSIAYLWNRFLDTEETQQGLIIFHKREDISVSRMRREIL